MYDTRTFRKMAPTLIEALLKVEGDHLIHNVVLDVEEDITQEELIKKFGTKKGEKVLIEALDSIDVGGFDYYTIKEKVGRKMVPIVTFDGDDEDEENEW